MLGRKSECTDINMNGVISHLRLLFALSSWRFPSSVLLTRYKISILTPETFDIICRVRGWLLGSNREREITQKQEGVCKCILTHGGWGEVVGLGGLGSLMEKAQHLRSSACLLHRVEERGRSIAPK